MTRDSKAIREGTASAELIEKYTTFAAEGRTMTATLANSTSRDVRIVDIREGKGVVFQFVAPFDIYYFMNIGGSNSNGGWPECDMRKNLNQMTYTDKTGTVRTTTAFSTYLNGMRVNGEDVEIQGVKIYSFDNTVADVVESTDKFWLPSVTEIYGEFNSFGQQYYSGNENCTQFIYYDRMGIDQTHYRAIASVPWLWLRTTTVYGHDAFYCIGNSGQCESSGTVTSSGTKPCFCI